MDKLSVLARRGRFAAAGAALLGLAGQALAAVPAEVTTAVGDMKTDALAVASAVLVAIIVVGAIKFIRRGM